MFIRNHPLFTEKMEDIKFFRFGARFKILIGHSLPVSDFKCRFSQCYLILDLSQQDILNANAVCRVSVDHYGPTNGGSVDSDSHP